MYYNRAARLLSTGFCLSPLRGSIKLGCHQCLESRVWVVDKLRIRPGLCDTTVYGFVSNRLVIFDRRREPSNTTIRSARAIVDNRCATSKHVVCFLRRILSIASLTWGNMRENVQEKVQEVTCPVFRCGIQCTRSFIQCQDGRFLQEGSSNCQSLPLTTGET